MQVPRCEKNCEELRNMFQNVVLESGQKIDSALTMQSSAILTKISELSLKITNIKSESQNFFAKMSACDTDKVLAEMRLNQNHSLEKFKTLESSQFNTCVTNKVLDQIKQNHDQTLEKIKTLESSQFNACVTNKVLDQMKQNHDQTLEKFNNLESSMVELKTYASQILQKLNVSTDKDNVETSLVKKVDNFGNMLHESFSQLEKNMEKQNLNVISALMQADKSIRNNFTTQHISLETIVKNVDHSVGYMFSSMSHEFFSLNETLAEMQLTCANADNWSKVFNDNKDVARKLSHFVQKQEEKISAQTYETTKTMASPTFANIQSTSTQSTTTTAKMQFSPIHNDNVVAKELKSLLNENDLEKIIEKTVISVLANKVDMANFEFGKKLDTVAANVHTQLFMLSVLSVFGCLTLFMATALFFTHCIRKQDRQAAANDPERAALQESSLTSVSERNNPAFDGSNRGSNRSSAHPARMAIAAPHSPRVDTRMYGDFERHRASTIASQQPGCSGISGRTWANNTFTSNATTDFYDAANFITDVSDEPQVDVYRPTVHESKEMYCLSKSSAL